MEEAKIKRSMAKAQYTRVEKALKKLVANPLSLQETVERKFEELRVKWQEVQDFHDRYASLVTTNEEEEAKEEEWINEICERFEAIEVDADKRLQRFKKENPPLLNQATLPQSGSPPVQAGASGGATHGLQLERLKLEKFNGDLRKYPAFRDGFMKHIAPMCQKSQKAFVLRAHLEEAVKEEVANIDDDLTLLWQRLDTKYGNLRKYTDTILSDLSKISQGGSKAALNLINTVEKAYQDLKRIGLEHEMSNSYIISVIEKKLPEEMRIDWIKSIAEKGEVDSAKVFMLMMEFLSRWRNIIEYDESAIRKAPERKVGLTHHAEPTRPREKSEVCWLHEDGKHPIWKCNLFRVMPVDEKINLIKKKNACQACLERNCSGSKDPEECERKFRCKVTECNKPHNLLIHQ
jgi:hypothetical protein